MKKIEIYSTPTCHFCHLAKDFLTEHNIAFTDYNVAEDMDKRTEAIEMSGQMGVPVISITEEGHDPIVMLGFNEELLRSTLNIA